MADIVRFGADASDYFNVVDRMRGSLRGLSGDVKSSGAAAAGFGGSDGGGLMGFLKGERAVKGQAKFLVASMLEARDATSAAESALQAFVYSTKVGLGAAVGATILFTAFKAIKEQIEAVAEAKRKLDETFSTSALTMAQGPEALGKQLEQQTAALEQFRKVSEDTKNVWVDIFQNKPTEGGFGLGATVRAGEQERSQEVAERERRIAQTAKARGQAELEVAQAKARVVKEGTVDAELALTALQYEQKRAELVAHPDQGTPTRLKALDVEQGVAAKKIKDKFAGEEEKRLKESKDFEMKNLDEYYAEVEKYEKERFANEKKRVKELIGDRLEAAQQKAKEARDELTLKRSPTDPTGLFGDIGGIAQNRQKYIQDMLAQQQKEQAGRDLLAEAQATLAAQKAGMPTDVTNEMSQLYNKVLAAAETEKGATTLEALAAKDFSSLASLGDLDFAGLQSLASLQIVIQ